MIRRYEDFEVVITKHGDQLYANLGAAPYGYHLAQPTPIILPDDRSAWIEMCQGHKDEAELAGLGYRLFENIIRGELAKQWHACLGRVESQDDTGLRLRFSTQTDALNQVPLELLCRQTQLPYGFLALSPSTPIVRSPRSGGSVKRRKPTLPLRMLVVIANPGLQAQIDPIAEQKGLEDALDSVIQSKRLMVDYLGLPDGPEADSRTLNRTLYQTKYPYDIVHFIGHGGQPDADDADSEGTLLMVSKKSGYSQPVRAFDVASMLAGSGVILAVLQACEGAQDSAHGTFRGMAQQLIAHGLPAVIAMRCRVDKDVAARFCAEFYDFWLNKDGLPIEHAVTQARLALHREFQDRATAWVVPVLFICSGSTEMLTINLDRPPFSIQIKRGEVLLERGEVDEAVAELEIAYNGAPDLAGGLLARALVAQAQARMDKGDIGDALGACERALKISPGEPTAQEMIKSINAQQRRALARADAMGATPGAYSPSAAPPELAIEDWPCGHNVDGRYEIMERMAVTSFCEIYKARELLGFCRIVAIKRLKPDELLLKLAEELKQLGGELKLEDVHERFEREIAILGRIEHRCVLRLLHDGGKVKNGDRYFATPFADKGSLIDYLQAKRGRLNSTEALKIAKAMCLGIDAIHKLGIVHRDIKPGNIFLFSESDGSTSVRLADFSIAGVPQAWVDKKITTAGDFMGTYPYTAPEQFDGSLSDPRLDLYAWAAVLFEMLTGKQFAQALIGEPGKISMPALVQYYRTSSEDELPITFLTNQGVPQEFATILQKALRIDPRRRYKSAQELQRDLDSITPPPVANIEKCLEAGQAHMKDREWQMASAEFEKGLALRWWYGEPNEMPDQVQGLFRAMEAEHLYAQAKVYLSEQQWQAAVEAFEELQKLDSTYLDVDVVECLNKARLAQQLAQKYDYICHLIGQKEWTTILQTTEPVPPDYMGPDGQSIGDIRKRALYEHGKELESKDPERTYYLLYDLYKEYPNYRDVTKLCADIAFRIGVRQDVSISWEQRVAWLGKVLEIAPDYGEGHAQELLDDSRHHWAEEVLDEDRTTAAAQLESISPGYTQWRKAYQKLVDVYLALLSEGNYVRKERSNADAEAEARYRLGIQRWGKGDSPGAAEQLTEIPAKAQEFHSARFALFQIYRALGDEEYRKRRLENALAWYMKAQGLEKSAKIGVTVQEVDVALRTALPPEESTWLRKRLIQYFDEEELRTLCSDLRVDYDSLQGKGKEAKARELVAYLGRRGRIHALIEMCIRLRPHVDWEETTHIPPPERSQIGD